MSTVDLSTLPINAQQELRDFYEFLQEKYVGNRPNPPQDPTIQVDFKTFILNIPKIEEVEFERLKDFPKDIPL
ncbi:MAG: DUF2281 domain-containing protein [Methylococcaceae bacterium]|jgi:hypothetical protein